MAFRTAQRTPDKPRRPVSTANLGFPLVLEGFPTLPSNAYQLEYSGYGRRFRGQIHVGSEDVRAGHDAGECRTDRHFFRTIRPREKGDEQGKSWTHNRVCAGQYGISRFLRPPRIVKSLLLATLSSNARSLSRIQKSGNAATVRHGNVRKMRCGPGFLAPH